jgi:peptidoglycan hydrolase CwlO-like protein
LEKERETISRLQSNDLSLERFEKLQEIIHELKSEITQLKQDKFAQTDQLHRVQEQANQLDIDNNELTIKMKQLKDLLEQRDQTIARIREKMLTDDDDEEKTTGYFPNSLFFIFSNNLIFLEIGDILSTVTETNSDNDEKQQQRKLLLTIDNDVEKANQHMRDLHSEIEEKTHRIKELDALVNQEKDRCRELETKLKVVLELRERDAHLHIRQLGQSDAELRKARTDTERVRILQQQLELKQ